MKTWLIPLIAICLPLIPPSLIFYICISQKVSMDTIGGTLLPTFIRLSCGIITFTLYPSRIAVSLLGIGIILIFLAFIMLLVKF